jgi:2-keto-4-pentenoate hydratase/2-oxohepta-3-ene-1,7-dioic acid hydratase in catechol pathway
MRFISFQYQGKNSWGAIEEDRVFDLSDRAISLKSAITNSSLPLSTSDFIEDAKTLAITDVKLLAPIPDPQRILCVGQNYAAHRDEMGGATTARPLIFTRFPSSIVGHEAVLIKPAESSQFDYEGELAVVIGKSGRRIPAEKALDYIAGYSCFMDGSVRDFQNHTTQYIPGKNFDHSGSFGPWMVSADEISDPNGGLRLQTRLNGQTVQQTTTDLMMFDVCTVIAYLSTFTTLEAGDVIATGTPSGVGYKREPQLFMQAGDHIEVEIESVGLLSNMVEQA